MAQCENQLGNHIFIGHNQLIVLGPNTKIRDPQELFGYFIQNKSNYLGVDVVMAEKTAKEVLQVQLNLGVTASENFTEILQMSYENGENIKSDLLHLLNATQDKDKTAIVPIVSVKDTKQKDKSSQSNSSDQSSESDNKEELITIKKAAVIHNGNIVGTIETPQIKGVNWMKNEINRSIVSIEMEGTPIGITVKHQHTKTKLKKIDDNLVYSLDIKALILTQDNVLRSYDKSEIKKKVEEKIVNSCKEAIQVGYKEYNCDLFDVLNYVRFYYPKIYLDYKDNFDELKKHIEFDINVNCLIR